MQNSTEAPNWDDIRVFAALARLGSLSATARVLGIEHSTVARRIDKLETQLGLRLFDRLSRGWRLSPEGEALATAAARMEDEADALQRQARGAAGLQGSVRISAPPAMASRFLAPRLASLHARAPGIELELMGETRDASLSRREADLALRMERPNLPGLVVRALAQLGYALFASPSHLEHPASAWRFIGYDDTLRRLPQQQWLEHYAGERPIPLRSNDVATQFEWARAGLGCAVLPYFLAPHDAGLCLVPNADCPVKRSLWLVMHPDLRRSPRVSTVAEELGAIYHEARGLLSGQYAPSATTDTLTSPRYGDGAQAR